MDHSIDKELAGWLHCNSCVQGETSDKLFRGTQYQDCCCVTSFPVTWTLRLSIPSASLGMIPTCVVGHTGGKGCDPEGSWQWACSQFMKFHKTNHLGRTNPKYKQRPGRERIQSSPEEEGSSVAVPQTVMTADYRYTDNRFSIWYGSHLH